MKKIKSGNVEVCGAPYPPVAITLPYEDAKKLRRVLGKQCGQDATDTTDVYLALNAYLYLALNAYLEDE